MYDKSITRIKSHLHVYRLDYRADFILCIKKHFMVSKITKTLFLFGSVWIRYIFTRITMFHHYKFSLIYMFNSFRLFDMCINLHNKWIWEKVTTVMYEPATLNSRT